MRPHSHFAVLALAAVAAVALALASEDQRPRKEISTRNAELALSREARREHHQLRDVECARSEGLPRAFICFAEGDDDVHLAFNVVVRGDGTLEVGQQ